MSAIGVLRTARFQRNSWREVSWPLDVFPRFTLGGTNPRAAAGRSVAFRPGLGVSDPGKISQPMRSAKMVASVFREVILVLSYFSPQFQNFLIR